MLCKICGKHRDEHHDFVLEIVMPAGCVCDPMTWYGGEVQPVCDQYVPSLGDGSCCKKCEHDKECHKQ
jgi:hypothetical protein